MTFLVRAGAQSYTAQVRARALDAWREAARLVSVRWEGVLIADRGARDDAFTAYLFALEAEAEAAAELANLHLADAA